MTEEEYLKKYLHPEDNYEEALKRLKAGEPLQYIVGDTEFYGNIIKVNKEVLIPRPETEELVEKTQEYIKEIFKTEKIDILDIGTGSGCISITLKKIFPNTNITGVDISEKALKIAEENKLINKVSINFKKSDIFSEITDKYDVIISNPPYIREDEEIMDIVKNNEPHLALYAKDNGLYFYKKIIKEAKDYVKDKFIIAFEIGEEQGSDVVELAHKFFPETDISLEKDLRSFDRFVFIKKI